MCLALPHRLFVRIRRVLILAVAPLLLVCLVLQGTAPPAAAAAGSGGVDISAGGPAAAPYVADEANFYQAAPANYYAEFWHENAINGKQYGFPYDDDAGQSSDISVTNPQYMVVAVGW